MFDYKQLTIDHSRPGLWTVTFHRWQQWYRARKGASIGRRRR